MVRRHQQEQRELRRASKAASEELASPHGSYIPPDRDTCRHYQWETAVDDLATIKLYFRIWRLGGKLVDFVVMVQRLGSSGWVDVERFDCCHGHSHLHVDNAENETQSIHTLDCVEDVKVAFVKVEKAADERARIMRDKGA